MSLLREMHDTYCWVRSKFLATSMKASARHEQDTSDVHMRTSRRSASLRGMSFSPPHSTADALRLGQTRMDSRALSRLRAQPQGGHFQVLEAAASITLFNQPTADDEMPACWRAVRRGLARRVLLDGLLSVRLCPVWQRPLGAVPRSMWRSALQIAGRPWRTSLRPCSRLLGGVDRRLW